MGAGGDRPCRCSGRHRAQLELAGRCWDCTDFSDFVALCRDVRLGPLHEQARGKLLRHTTRSIGREGGTNGSIHSGEAHRAGTGSYVGTF